MNIKAMIDDPLGRAIERYRYVERRIEELIENEDFGDEYTALASQANEMKAELGMFGLYLLGKVEQLEFQLEMEKATRMEWLLTSQEALTFLTDAGWKPPAQNRSEKDQS